ncbi:acyl-CoA dehydrogenase family protein [Lentzea albidocapillata]|uniref:acyl-CoA dehydrogenase family protein n=1 Tax=Lentzea albidocapillata TaxID=40571 RepID=UPI0012FC8AE6|nr:acyl-CoA dehydrogenase family protein [Lentzea albidocapillata]
MATAHEAITAWLRPLRRVLDPGGLVDWARLEAFADALDRAVGAYPVEAEPPAGGERSRRLRTIRRDLAASGLAGPEGDPALFHVLVQFVCGYRDIDLRDSFGLGHGSLIADHGSPGVRQKWIPRLRAGELAGIAITECHGGSRPAETRTQAVAGPGGTWLVTGRKTWISRLNEAAVFVLFFRTPDGRLAAAAVDATEEGLRRQPIPPTGLAGWAWGVLELDAVPIRRDDVLDGSGMRLLRQHFAGYRPLVTATALGGAAAVFDTVTARLSARQFSGELPRLRDSALITLGRAHVQLATALLGTVMASNVAEAGGAEAELWGAATKAHGIDVANTTVAELALLLGASGFRADCQTAKIRRDLNGLLYADGIHDSLYRAAGKHHVDGAKTTVPPPRSRLESAARTA